MKTKRLHFLLTLIVALVTQGFASIGWGQIVESVGETTNIIVDLEALFNYDESNKKYNSESLDLAISDTSDWNNLANICNRHYNSNIKNAIKTVRIVGNITFDATVSITTIDSIPSGVTLSSDVSTGSGIHTISGTTKPLINVLEGTLKYVALDGASCDISSDINSYTNTQKYTFYSPFVILNKGTIFGCQVSNCSITDNDENGITSSFGTGAIAAYNHGKISNCIVKNNKLLASKQYSQDIYIGHIAGSNYEYISTTDETIEGSIDSCYCQIPNEDYLFGYSMKSNDTNTNIQSNGIAGHGVGNINNNLIAFIPNDTGVYFENAKSQTTYDYYIRYLSPQAGSANNWTHYKSRSELQVQINKFLNNAANYLVRSETPETVYINGIEVSVYPPMICPQQASMKKEYESSVIKSINSASEWNQMAKDYQYSSLDPAIEKIQISNELDFTETIVRGIELPEGIILDGGGYKIYGVAEKFEFDGKTNTYSSPLVRKNEGVIQNVFIDGLFICSDNATTLNYAPYYSLLCGENNGTIQHCGVQNSKITVPNSNGDTDLTAHLGFLVADNNGIVDHCYAACNGYALPDGLTSSSVVLSQLVADSEEGTINESFAVDLYFNSNSNHMVERAPLCGSEYNNDLKNNAIFLINTAEITETDSPTFLGSDNHTYCQYTCSSEGVNDNNANSVKVYTSVAKLERYIKDYADNNNWVMNGKYMYYDNGSMGMEYGDYNKYSVKIDNIEIDFPSLDLKGTIVSDKNKNRLIRSAEDWKALCTAEVRPDVLMSSSGKVILMNDIELNAKEFNYTMSRIGEMCNGDETFVFEGNGHTITLSPKYENDIAVLYPLFDEIFPKATVRNLIVLTNSEMGDYSELSTDNIYYGLLANTNNGTIESCAVLTQEIFQFSAQYSYTKEVTPNVYIGVMVGENKGTIKESFVAYPYGYFEVSVSCVYNDSSLEEQEYLGRKLYVGGIVGKNSGSILDSYVKMAGISITTKGNETDNNISAISGVDGENAVYERVFYNNDIDMVFSSSGSSYDPTNPEVKKMYDSEGTENPESGDNLYDENEENGPYYNLPTFTANFSNPMKWTHLKKREEQTDTYISNWPIYSFYEEYSAPILTFSNVDAVIDEETKIVDLILTDTTEVAEFTEAIKTNPEVYSNSIVTLGNNIDYSNDDADPDNPETLPAFNQLGGGTTPFNGTFDGSGYSIVNMQVQADSKGSGGFFKNIGNSAVVKNLNLENATIVITSADSVFTYSNGNEIDVQDTIYIPVFADRNRGELQNCSFVGTVKIDETIAEDKVVKVCFVGENYAKKDSETSEEEQPFTLDHAFIYLTDDTPTETETEGNKVCIVIKQHIGVGRLQQRVRKTCSNRKSNKALTLDPDLDLNDEAQAEINSEYREFTDEEFASGKVAYWLNYEGTGHTGDYTYEWTQGPLYPILDLNKSAALVKIVYVIEGESAETIFNAPSYGNIGSTITMTYSETPSSISVESQKITVGANSSNFIVPQPTGTKKGDLVYINVNVNYSNNTAISDNNDLQLNISSVGNEIYIAGAKGERVQLYSIRGHVLTDTEASADYMKIVIPNAGIYIVKAGNTTKKIIVR